MLVVRLTPLRRDVRALAACSTPTDLLEQRPPRLFGHRRGPLDPDPVVSTRGQPDGPRRRTPRAPTASSAAMDRNQPATASPPSALPLHHARPAAASSLHVRLRSSAGAACTRALDFAGPHRHADLTPPPTVSWCTRAGQSGYGQASSRSTHRVRHRDALRPPQRRSASRSGKGSRAASGSVIWATPDARPAPHLHYEVRRERRRPVNPA